MLLSIVIPLFVPEHLVHKIDKFLKPQLESFRSNTTLAGIELVYVANGCVQQVQDVLMEYQKHMPIKIIWCEKGLGFTISTNIGIRHSMGDIVLLMNDDAIILDYIDSLRGKKDCWLRWLINPFFEDPTVGITGIHELFCTHSQCWFFVGYCVALRRTMLEQIGLLDEIFSPGSGEDTDICIRARLYGWRTSNVDSNLRKVLHEGGELKNGDFTFPIWHPAESTFHHWEALNDFKPGSKWDVIFARNSQILADRLKSGYYDSVNVPRPTVPLLEPRPPMTLAERWCGSVPSKIDHICPS